MSKLSDLDIPVPDAEDFTSVTLSKCNGQTLEIKSTDFKKLGSYNGVVFTLGKPINVEAKDWSEVHSTSNRVINKAQHDNFQGALKAGGVTCKVVSGKTDKGTWYDIE